MRVANEDIDGYLAYRLINVGYILWEKMGIYQRDLSSYNEKPILRNRNTKGNCINCHSFCNNDPDRIMFHMRAAYSGTIISIKDSLFKVNMSTPYTMSAGVYPSWHPDGQHIALSVNIVRQWFHAVDKRNEVYDRASDLIVYNLKTNTITTSPKVSTKRRETLPCWSPDGRYLYYCSAPELSDTIKFDEVKYDLLRIPFNTETNEWGEVDTVLLSSELGKSISFPKISPDGKYLIFCLASHGYFTIYNVTSDLYIMNLETGKYYPFPYNSNSVDSYHSWSSNGRWFVFSSKRSNGLCARPYISYFDENGNSYKPFVLPQKDPRFYYSFIYNYNVPELIKSSVSVNRNKLLETVISDPENAIFDRNVDLDALSGASRFADM
jgi:Tol biopolymer transport system component